MGNNNRGEVFARKHRGRLVQSEVEVYDSVRNSEETPNSTRGSYKIIQSSNRGTRWQLPVLMTGKLVKKYWDRR